MKLIRALLLVPLLVLLTCCANRPDPAMILLRRISMDTREDAAKNAKHLEQLTAQVGGLEQALTRVENTCGQQKKELDARQKTTANRWQTMARENEELKATLASLQENHLLLQKGFNHLKQALQTSNGLADQLAQLGAELKKLVATEAANNDKKISILTKQLAASKPQPPPDQRIDLILNRLDRLETDITKLHSAKAREKPADFQADTWLPQSTTSYWPWFAGCSLVFLTLLIFAWRAGRKRKPDYGQGDGGEKVPTAPITADLHPQRTEPPASLHPGSDDPPQRIMVDLDPAGGQDENELTRASGALLRQAQMVLVEPEPEFVARPGGKGIRIFFYLPGFAQPGERDAIIDQLHRLEAR